MYCYGVPVRGVWVSAVFTPTSVHSTVSKQRPRWGPRACARSTRLRCAPRGGSNSPPTLIPTLVRTHALEMVGNFPLECRASRGHCFLAIVHGQLHCFRRFLGRLGAAISDVDPSCATNLHGCCGGLSSDPILWQQTVAILLSTIGCLHVRRFGPLLGLLRAE